LLDEEAIETRNEVERAVERVWRHTRARRELLWLRAMESQDQFIINLLEQADATLRARMTALLEARGLPTPDDPRCRDAVYAAFWEEHFSELTAAASAGREEGG
jgi:protoheme ferro-lyase